ncbi:MAG: RagB/SusD family nutrient uptake outer membrane protein, partial [Porphyromonas sp.]|nr:RagB/SusD family nutrient uptake outer membrane protein [Porphyromonas sp.]
MKSTVYKAFVVGALLGVMPACSLLDREPLDQIGPSNFYSSAEQLSSFTIKLYDAFPNNIGGWTAGIAAWDDGTDNQAVKDGPNQGMFSLDAWKVPSEGGLGFNTIRDINYFIGVVEDKMASNAIAGNATDIKHYLGEAYFFRAYHYFGKLKAYGDFPIVKVVLGDTEEVLKENAKRQPRNQVARFILEDLDKALTLLRPTTPGNQRVSQQVAHLFRSRVALYEGTFERYHRGSGRVPGDDKWPGKDKEWNKGFQINQEEEVRYFLTEAMKSAKQVADGAQLTNNTKVLNPESPTAEWNPYFQMFGSNNLAGYPEVLLWRQHSRAASVLHHQSARILTGTKTGWTRSLVESFLTEDGKPLYAVRGRSDKTIKEVKAGRDYRLQLFMFAEDDVLRFVGSTIDRFTNAQLLESSETKESTGYRQRKGLN